MASFSSLPGELTAIIRQSIPSDDLNAHLAFNTVAQGARLALYDENVWRELCYANGCGGMFCGEVSDGWRKSILVLTRYQKQADVSYCRQYGPLQWAKALRLTRTPFPTSICPSLELNPAFASLSFDRRALAAGHGLAAAYLHTQPWDVENHKGRTIADQIAEFIPTRLDHHIGAYALATVPAVSELSVMFDHWGSTLDAAATKEACSFSSDLAEVRRENGVRVIDVVGGIVKWLTTPLTDTQVDRLVELDRLLDPELYAMLEFSTDPDTLAAYWRRKYRRRGDVFRANFAGLRTIEGSPNTVRAVWCPEIRFEVLGYDGVVNAKEIGNTPAAGSWLAAQINQIATMV